jgi:hypothetical protein
MFEGSFDLSAKELVDTSFSGQPDMVEFCQYCKTLFVPNKQMACSKAKVFIDSQGKLVQFHSKDKHFDFASFVLFLSTSKNYSWKHIFWMIWGLFQTFQCSECNDVFTGA